MGSINNIFSSIFPSFSAQPSSGSGCSAAATSSDAPKFAYGSAFELSLTEIHNADGSESDFMSFGAYSASADSNSSAFVANGSGSSAQSAFEAMLASLQGIGVADADGIVHMPDINNGDGSGITASTVNLQGMFDIINQDMNNLDEATNSSITGGGLLTRADGAPMDASSSGNDAISKFMQSAVTSLENALDDMMDANSQAMQKAQKAGMHHHHHIAAQQAGKESDTSSTGNTSNSTST
ncbi:MAG TPA: hypothetical protein VFT64_07635 [Rickettsiales bacterium]|nr:hypothetical protein [Rickettsiales bacterium]